MTDEREAILDVLNEAILSVWDLAALDDDDPRSSSRAMASAALAYLESEGFAVVRVPQ